LRAPTAQVRATGSLLSSRREVPMKKKDKIAISHADISKALQKFKSEGGLINRLPDQIVPKGVLVGGKFSAYESVFDPSASGSSNSNAASSEAAE
jgi:hypothetical protein